MIGDAQIKSIRNFQKYLKKNYVEKKKIRDFLKEHKGSSFIARVDIEDLLEEDEWK